MHILVTTDYSPISINAFRYALHFGRMYQCRITLVHIYKIQEINISLETGSNKVREYFEADQTKKLNDFRFQILKSIQMNPEKTNTASLAVEGNVSRDLLNVSNYLNADFIFIGTHGVSGLQNFVVEDHAWKIIQKANIPVFVIPRNAEFTGIRKIILPTTFIEEELPVIDYTVQLAQSLKSSISLFHISKNDIPSETEKKEGELFIQKYNRQNITKKIELSILKKDNFLDSIKKFSSIEKAECIVLSNNQSFRLANIYPSLFRNTKKLSDQTKIPLLIIPTSYGLKNKKNQLLEMEKISD
jgi:nucleotide-binding universal stress UspA family protein